MVGDLCPHKGVEGSIFVHGRGKLCSVAVYPPSADKSVAKERIMFSG
jgi:hypothetical protein